MEIKIFIGLALVFLIGYLLFRGKRAKQLEFIESYKFPSKISTSIKKSYPHLSDTDVKKVTDALRDYFHMCNLGKNRMVAMPSQVVDVAWHEFILFTRNYKGFCEKALGRFLHHTPTEAMKTPTLAQDGIKRAWRLACAKENIDPSSPSKLPLIFAIDAMLNIEDGFKYSLNCQDKSSPMYGDGYCAGHIGCTSGCAGDTGGHTGTDSSDSFFSSSGDSSCGGGGCGGD